MSKIIPIHVITSNGQEINAIWGLNSNRIFEEIIYAGNSKTKIRYQIDLNKNNKEDIVIEGKPVDIYKSVHAITNPETTSLTLVNGNSQSISIENVIYCYADLGNFNYSYVYVFRNNIKELYHVNQSFLSLLETLNTQA